MRRGRVRRLLRLARRALAACVLLVAVVIALAWVLPFPWAGLDRWGPSPVVEDRHGRLLLARLDEQDHWCWPVALEDVSPWLVRATLAAEDARFRHHPGVDPLAVGRALLQNAAAGRVASGASTITMQVARMAEDRPRTLGAKLVEAFRAVQLELRLDKDAILERYLNAAPYGGNVRGVEAAARRYLGRSARDLSVAEAALLAGLPQAPERYRPDRRPDAALGRRDVVLARMVAEGMIDEATRRRAAAEPLRLAGPPPPPRAWHAAWWALGLAPRGGRTTLDLHLQQTVERAVADHLATLPARAEVAVVVASIDDGAIRALVGSPDPHAPAAGQVNGATAWRSPGSALKPFLYAEAMAQGWLAADTPLDDRPARYGDWAPTNFDETFAGEATAAEALRRSLNLPAIALVRRLGMTPTRRALEAVGLGFRRPVDEAGLALATGAAEVRLVDLVEAYATLGRGGVHRDLVLLPGGAPSPRRVLPADVVATVDEILGTRHRRPRGLEGVPDAALPHLVWKTGTSAGRRDAWAVGHNGRWAAGVWVGDFSGVGHHAFVGAEAAEPLLARLMALPALRVEERPPPPAPLVVRRPPPPVAPPPADAAPRIVRPRPEAQHVAIGPTAWVPLEVEARAGSLLFVDGALREGGPPAGLALPPGTHEIRVVDPLARGVRVRIHVR